MPGHSGTVLFVMLNSFIIECREYYIVKQSAGWNGERICATLFVNLHITTLEYFKYLSQINKEKSDIYVLATCKITYLLEVSKAFK